MTEGDGTNEVPPNRDSARGPACCRRVDVALDNGTKFGADASYSFDGVEPAEVDKTATIHATGTITGDDSHNPGQGSDGQIQVSEP